LNKSDAAHLSPGDFKAFFNALHGFDPFPWQARLAESVTTTRAWPSTLSVPTAAGKTAIIDIAIFHLALEAVHAAAIRKAPRRIFFVVDRRVVVDEAFLRAQGIAEQLQESLEGPPGIVRTVARNLLSLGGELPLSVARMRGGMYQDHGWAKSPAQPSVCVSTVDQVGSRLLFRGYGVSESARPIHAGLVGSDSLIVVDEAHLSKAFVDSLNWVKKYRSDGWASHPPETPFSVVRMSATVASADSWLEDEDRKHAVLGPRLKARKHARLTEVKADKDEPEGKLRERFAEHVAEEAETLLTQTSSKRIPAPVIAVVVNRVATARRVFELLRKSVESTGDGASILLTGRVRPFDRDRIFEEWLPHLSAGREERSAENGPLYVVATQTVEVGANFDFDGLITEMAPIDALRQRFGRVDRLGRRGKTESVIVARKDHIKRGYDDPIYGRTLPKSWKWLKEHQQGKGKNKYLDMSADRFPVPDDAEEMKELSSPGKAAPTMMPAHIDSWAQTSPASEPSPDVSVFLHGAESGPADVNIVWRGDLPEQLTRDDAETYVSTVSMVTPSSMEALPVPIWEVRAWLKGTAIGEIGDVEGEAEPTPERGSRDKESRPALVWRGPEDSKLVTHGEIWPGDTIVVPSSYGGCDGFGWNPNSTEAVSDVADACYLLARRKPCLRLHPGVLKTWDLDDESGFISTITSVLPGEEFELEESIDKLDPILGTIADENSAPSWMVANIGLIASLLRETRGSLLFTTYGSPLSSEGKRSLMLTTRRRVSDATLNKYQPTATQLHGDTEAVEYTTEDDTSSLSRPVTLAQHSQDVKTVANRFARTCGLPDAIVDDITLAAWLHDSGKADPRFQVCLHGGDQVAALAAESLLAKSGTSPSNWPAALALSGYPKGMRHEALSAAMVTQSDEVRRVSNDVDLVTYLVGTHHGRGRPFFKPTPDDQPVLVKLTLEDGTILSANSNHHIERLDSGWVDRFWALTRRYGYWGVAYMEAILRLADHRASELEAEGEAVK